MSGKIVRLKQEYQQKVPQKKVSYTSGAEGMIRWCEENVCVPVYREESDVQEWCPIHALPREKSSKTHKSYWYLWEEQKRILREALKMENNRFKYRLIVFCWMRGEGKSLLACLIQLWKFFCFPRQQIMLGANSKDQVKFVHYDIMRDIIFNSPRLLSQVGKKHIQEKEIRLRDKRGRVNSLIRSISSFSGIVSNITGYTFSEIFDMKNPRFFVQLDGSIRNMPNALGVIDSTVSAKNHVLYDLYENYVMKKTRTVFFSYRYSNEGRMEDYWNPNMDDDQLNDYRMKFPFGEFERYFLNLWSAGSVRVFSDEVIAETEYIGFNGEYMNHVDVEREVERKHKVLRLKGDCMSKGFTEAVLDHDIELSKIESRLLPVEKVYSLRTPFQSSKSATVDTLEKLSDILDTDWAIGIGVDMADPMATNRATASRTILCSLAKGLIGSRRNPYLYETENAAPAYCYFLIHALSIEDHSLETCKRVVDEMAAEFDGVDSFCGERWGIWDMQPWCEERSIKFEAVYPTYDRQRESFKELYNAAKEGRLKIPPLAVMGSKGHTDIFREEASIFFHDSDKRWFGSPEKHEKHGIQDDFLYALAWCMYGMRFVNSLEFRARKGAYSFGTFLPNPSLVGNY